MNISGILKKYILNRGKSIKDQNMENILEKLRSGKVISDREVKFMQLYEETTADIKRDFMMLSKNMAFDKIRNILDHNLFIICNLYDRDGKIGKRVLDIKNDMDSVSTEVILLDNTRHHLHDRYLYNIIYKKEDEYSLEEHGEYYEKIEIDK